MKRVRKLIILIVFLYLPSWFCYKNLHLHIALLRYSMICYLFLTDIYIMFINSLPINSSSVQLRGFFFFFPSLFLYCIDLYALADPSPVLSFAFPIHSAFPFPSLPLPIPHPSISPPGNTCALRAHHALGPDFSSGRGGCLSFFCSFCLVLLQADFIKSAKVQLDSFINQTKFLYYLNSCII